MRSLSLGTRIALIVLAGTLATVASVFVIAYTALVEDFETILTEQQKRETRDIAASVDQRLQFRLGLLEEVANTFTDGDKLYPIKTIKQLINRQETLRRLFPGGILLLDSNARAIAENQFVPGRIGTNYSDRPHFQRAIKTRSPLISRPIMGRTTGVPLLSFVAPIESDEGDLLGLISGSLELGKTSIIPSEIVTDFLEDDAFFTVLDTNNFLYVEGEAVSGSSLQPLPGPGVDPLIDSALSGITFGQVTGIDGRNLIYATSHLQRLGWMFLRAVPYERATAPAQASFVSFFSVSLGIALVIALASWRLSRSATLPLDRITRRIERMVRTPSRAARLDPAGPPEVRNLAYAFNRLMDEREAISDMKEHFVSNVSHELRTPLTSMNGALRLIDSGAAGTLPERAWEMNRLALRNSERLQLLISDLLDFSKLSAGQMTVSLRPKKLRPVIEAAIAANRGMAEDHQVVLTSRCPPTTHLLTDDHRLRQVLDNYISNAIKFSPPSGTIAIHSEMARNPDFMRITVSDQGNGVPQQFVEQLFERFSQAETGTSRSAKGTGLGLAICRELATLMGGCVGYYYSNGASFWIELPIHGHATGEDHENSRTAV